MRFRNFCFPQQFKTLQTNFNDIITLTCTVYQLLFTGKVLYFVCNNIYFCKVAIKNPGSNLPSVQHSRPQLCQFSFVSAQYSSCAIMSIALYDSRHFQFSSGLIKCSGCCCPSNRTWNRCPLIAMQRANILNKTKVLSS